jgi:predicted phage baseplate assembly protein
MPLKPPKLDTRTAERLFEEARLRIPQYTPEWTDFNDSDPGITLLQLYAWLTDIMLFEMNRLPELNYIKFLQMLDMRLASAKAATAHLTVIPDGKVGIVSLPPFSRVEASPPNGEPVTFEIDKGLDVSATPLAAVVVYDGARPINVTQQNNDALGETFRPFGWQARPGSMLYLGFAAPKPEEFDRFINKRIFPDRLSLRVFLKADKLAGKPQRSDDAPPQPPVTLVWEAKREGSERWWMLNHTDESNAFLSEGYIQITTALLRPKATKELDLPDEYYWLRCTLQQGNYPAGQVPEIDFIRANVAEASSLTTERDEFVSVSEGRPDQTFTLARRPIQPGTLELEIRRPRTQGDDETEVALINAPDRQDAPWERVDDFLSSGRGDNHYTLDATTGEIRFGNGKQGKVPPAGMEIIARRYRYGGGTMANVAAGLIAGLVAGVPGANSLMVTNERAAVGGTDEQQIENLMEEAPRRLRSQDRAVTAEDFESLAADVGGVARAKALALMHPNYPGVPVPGAVTVALVPDKGGENAPQPPTPSVDLIRVVAKSLDAKRPITTELYVKGPSFLPVHLSATVEIDPYASAEEVKRSIQKALRDSKQLDPYQQEFGKAFYPTNLYSVILGVESVRAVTRLLVKINDTEIPANEMGNPYPLPPDGLLYNTDHEIITRLPGDGSQ